MALYASGKPAAITAIKAAVAARTSTLSDGSLSLDAGSLQQWLIEQANAIIASDVLPIHQVAATGVLATVDISQDSANLAAYIGRGNWQGRADWPTSLELSQGSGLVDSVYKTTIDMENAVREIEQAYNGAYQQIESVANSTVSALGLDAKIPATTVRIIDSRYVVYTHVTARGEESAPSPVSDLMLCDQNDKENIVIGLEPANRFITKYRVYRSNVGSQGAEFQFEGEYPIDTKNITTAVLSSALGEICPTTLWVEPPTNLRGLVNMPNGIMAGFFDNTVCFCESFVPYAWPVGYQLTVPYPIIALGTFGQTLVVMHQGGVDYISGADSASMSIQKDISKQACVSFKSVALVEGGVLYASPEGLCLATGRGVELITKKNFMRKEWRDFNPASIIGGYVEQTYFGNWNNGVKNGVFMLHLPTLKLTTVDLVGTAVFSDTKTNILYLAQGNNVVALFQGTDFRVGTWRSKISVMPKHTSFAWLTVESNFEFPITVKWYVDAALAYTVVLTSLNPVRLPAVRGQEHEIEIVTKARWNCITMASSTQELQEV